MSEHTVCVPQHQFSMQRFGKFCRRNNCTKVTKELSASNKPLLILNELFSHFSLPVNYGMACSESVARSIIYHCYLHGSLEKYSFEELSRSFIIKYNVSRNERFQKKKEHTILDVASENVIKHLPASKFYASKEWKSIRYIALSKYGNTCMACGVSPKQGAIIHVDHIKPRSIFPEFSLDLSNLQILCENCNIGKSNKSSEDWRN